MRDKIIIILICILVSCAGCYKTVLIKHDEEKWWENRETWIKASGYKGLIKVENVEADSVYGVIDLGLFNPAYKQVVVPLDSVKFVKRKKVDPVLSIFGFTLLAGTVLGAVYIVSLSKIALD